LAHPRPASSVGRVELTADGAKIPVVSAPPDSAALDVKDRYAADGPLSVGGGKSVEIADMGATHPPFEHALPVVLKRSNGLNPEIGEGAQEAGCPVADALLASIDDVERDILVLTILGEKASEPLDIVPRPGSSPLLS
jgi:hypothetical protein